MRVLLLAGTGEARQLATALRDAGIDTVASLAGATRDPARLDVATRHGGFGGRDAFASYLNSERITAVLDATHPFAARISTRSWEVCRELGLPCLQLLRPPWRPEAQDRWTEIGSEQEAGRHITPPATVFLATGRQTLEGFAALSGCRLICRQIDPPEGPFPFANGEFLVGRPPFSVSDEVALFARLGVDWLVVKNAGGTASRSKLDAARALELPVLMIARPASSGAPRVETVGQALDWVKGLT